MPAGWFDSTFPQWKCSRTGRPGREPGEHICRHLARHGIAARSQYYRANGIGTGDLILSWAADDGADLIVMGPTAMRGGASLSWAG